MLESSACGGNVLGDACLPVGELNGRSLAESLLFPGREGIGEVNFRSGKISIPIISDIY